MVDCTKCKHRKGSLMGVGIQYSQCKIFHLHPKNVRYGYELTFCAVLNSKLDCPNFESAKPQLEPKQRKSIDGIRGWLIKLLS